MTRAIVYSENGGPEVLRLVDLPDPVPGAGEVVVSVRAAGVNPIDWKLRAGIRGPAVSGAEQRVGADAAGVVARVGHGVETVAVGDAVIVRAAHGAYATHVVASVDQLVAKPEALDWEQAAAIGIPAGTAYQALRSLGVGADDTLLLHGGSGGVGQAAIQFAVAAGARVIATASPANHDRLRELGASPVAYGEGLADRVRALAPHGVTVALDAAGTDEAIETSLELVADRDRIGTVVRGFEAAGWGIRAWSGGNPVPLTGQENAWRREATGIATALAADGRFSLEIAERYPLEQAAEAHRRSETGHVRGKIVIVV